MELFVNHVQEKQIVLHVQQHQTNVQHVQQIIIQVEVDALPVLPRDAVNVIQPVELVHHVSVDIIYQEQLVHCVQKHQPQWHNV